MSSTHSKLYDLQLYGVHKCYKVPKYEVNRLGVGRYGYGNAAMGHGMADIQTGAEEKNILV